MIETVKSWEEFREKWTGGDKRQNFLLRGAMFPFQFQPPPLEVVLDVVRSDEATRILKGREDKGISNEPYPEFRDLPLDSVVQANALLAHFDARRFAGPGDVFEGLNEIFDGWYQRLSEHGFTHDETLAQRAFFYSAAHRATGYHFDSSYVLVWQVVGRKRFCWLKEPERWCPREVLVGAADRYDRMKKPEGITSSDVIECEMEPGDVLWNVMLTPHWVYALDEPTYSFNLTHFNLCCDGEASLAGKELAAIRRERELLNS